MGLGLEDNRRAEIFRDLSKVSRHGGIGDQYPKQILEIFAMASFRARLSLDSL